MTRWSLYLLDDREPRVLSHLHPLAALPCGTLVTSLGPVDGPRVPAYRAQVLALCLPLSGEVRPEQATRDPELATFTMKTDLDVLRATTGVVDGRHHASAAGNLGRAKQTLGDDPLTCREASHGYATRRKPLGPESPAGSRRLAPRRTRRAGRPASARS